MLDPRVLVSEGIRSGLDGVAITEHNRLWSKDELSRLRDETGSNGFVLLSGIEVDIYWHHLLIFNYPYPINRTLSLKRLLDTIREAGGVAVLAHPFRYGRLANLDQGKLSETFRMFDAVELLTPDHSMADNRQGLALWQACRLTATGGSDSHVPSQVGTCATEFSIPVRSEEDLARAIRGGRCIPRFGNRERTSGTEGEYAMKRRSA